jgi:hypothetical protein
MLQPFEGSANPPKQVVNSNELSGSKLFLKEEAYDSPYSPLSSLSCNAVKRAKK